MDYGGATLTAVLKDVLIWITVIAVIVIVPLSISGGFGTAFRDVKPSYLTVPSPLITGYVTLTMGGRQYRSSGKSVANSLEVIALIQ